ncbi:MAG: glycosyltransferase, partial [Thermoplasmatales archaeon]
FEVIVVDNGSKENEKVLIDRKFFNFAKTFRLKKNLGFTGGNNWALNKAKGKYIVLLNNDTIVNSNWLNPLVTIMEKDKKIAVVQPKIRSMQNRKYFDYAGAAGGFIDKYGYPFTRGRIFNSQEVDRGQYDGEAEIFWASGSACMIRRSIINKVGGLFSENLFNYMEEIDFCWRVWRAGYVVKFISESIVYHKVASTANRNLVKKRYWEHRNNLYILFRNLDKLSLVKILPIRIFLEMFTYVYYLSSKQFKYTVSLFFAHKDFIINSINIRAKRNRRLNHEKLPKYPRSIIVDHFIKKKKEFSNLHWSPKGNISYVLFNTKVSGGTKVIFEHIEKFKSRGYEARVYTLLGKKPSNLPATIKVDNILYSLFNIVPDVLVATFWPTSFFVLLMRAKKKFYLIQDWEEYFYKNILMKKLVKSTYSLSIKKIVISEYLRKKILKTDKSKFHISKIKYYVLDCSTFKSNNRSFKKSNNQKVRILSVISWYNLHKGVDILANSVHKLKKFNKNYHFTLVSKEAKPYSPIFDKFISDPSKNLLASLYRKSDFLLSTSRTEGFFIPGLEAMACGCIFITTNSGGVLEYARNNVNSIVVKNPKVIWKKDVIKKLLSKPSKIKMLIKNGKKTASYFCSENIINEIEGIYFKQ